MFKVFGFYRTTRLYIIFYFSYLITDFCLIEIIFVIGIMVKLVLEFVMLNVWCLILVLEGSESK